MTNDTLVYGGEEAASAAPYVLSFTAPAGLPWDQRRLARLEAENSAPLDLEVLRYDLRRIDPWRLGQPSRFAVAYFHRDAVVGPVSHLQSIDSVEVRFRAGDEQAERAEEFARLGQLLAPGVGLLAVIGAFLLALSDRADGDAALATARLQAQKDLVIREQLLRRHAEQRVLERTTESGSPLSIVLDDLGWVARARDPGASLKAVEWTPGGLLLTASGPSNPMAGRDRPVTPASVPGATSQWIVAPDSARTAREAVR